MSCYALCPAARSGAGVVPGLGAVGGMGVCIVG